MTEQQPLVTWHAVPAGAGRLLADLPHGCFASIEPQAAGVYYVLLGCDGGPQPFVLRDIFADRAVAQAWVEDKARLLARGIDIEPN
jgi:hypothetical protein